MEVENELWAFKKRVGKKMAMRQLEVDDLVEG